MGVSDSGDGRILLLVSAWVGSMTGEGETIGDGDGWIVLPGSILGMRV
jgi:hypothetical protein